MAIQVQRWQAVCSTCPRWIWWERIKTEVPGTKEVVISRCDHCNKRQHP